MRSVRVKFAVGLAAGLACGGERLSTGDSLATAAVAANARTPGARRAGDRSDEQR